MPVINKDRRLYILLCICATNLAVKMLSVNACMCPLFIYLIEETGYCEFGSDAYTRASTVRDPVILRVPCRAVAALMLYGLP